jgi:FkbM family methyltransferase
MRQSSGHPIPFAGDSTLVLSLRVREQLRQFRILRQSVRLLRRGLHSPRIFRSYVRVLGVLPALQVLAATIFSRHEVLVTIPALPHPLRIRPRTSDKYCFEQIFLDEIYQLPIDISPRAIVDCGANVGYASVYFANRYPRARIVSIEPEPSNFKALVANTAAYPNIILVEAAIWPSPGRLVVDSSDSAWESRVSTPVNGLLPTVEAVTLQDIFARCPANALDVAKIDIEGAEKEVFSSGCHSWLGSVRVLIVELHDRIKSGCTEAFEQALEGQRFMRVVRKDTTILYRDSPATVIASTDRGGIPDS